MPTLYMVQLGGRPKGRYTPFNAASHIDDKLLVDLDEIYNINELLSAGTLKISADKTGVAPREDKSYIGYLSIKNLRKL